LRKDKKILTATYNLKIFPRRDEL